MAHDLVINLYIYINSHWSVIAKQGSTLFLHSVAKTNTAPVDLVLHLNPISHALTHSKIVNGALHGHAFFANPV